MFSFSQWDTFVIDVKSIRSVISPTSSACLTPSSLVVLCIGRMGISVVDVQQQVAHMVLFFSHSALTEEVCFSLFWLKTNSLQSCCPWVSRCEQCAASCTWMSHLMFWGLLPMLCQSVCVFNGTSSLYLSSTATYLSTPPSQPATCLHPPVHPSTKLLIF